MTSTQPKYSILIPTRNRCEYVGFAIQSILDQPFSNCEVIVSDNHSSDSTFEYLAMLGDPRLRITQPPRPLSMTMHYEYLLSLAQGEWVTIVGDDDGVMPYFFECLERVTAQFTEIDIISSRRSHYFWDGCQDIYGDVVVSYQSSAIKKLRSTKRDLVFALADLRSCFDMPQIYTTCVLKRQLISDIKERSGGQFYKSIIPDMYSVVALSLQSDRYLRLEDPLFWVGTSNKSMAISDRIYRDAESISPEGPTPVMPSIRLNSGITEKLHAVGSGPLYLYECLLQCPLSNNFWKGRMVSTIVYASILILLQRCDSTKGRASTAELRLCLGDQVSKTGVSLWIVKSCAYTLRFLMALRLIILLSDSVKFKLLKLLRIGRRYSLVSDSRILFPNILSASKAVIDLRETST
jgi:glycosyltransferase involved in cell wall biosynthesis